MNRILELQKMEEEGNGADDKCWSTISDGCNNGADPK